MLRRRRGTELPLRMAGRPWLTGFGLLFLVAIFTVGFMGEGSRQQVLSTLGDRSGDPHRER